MIKYFCDNLRDFCSEMRELFLYIVSKKFRKATNKYWEGLLDEGLLNG